MSKNARQWRFHVIPVLLWWVWKQKQSTTGVLLTCLQDCCSVPYLQHFQSDQSKGKGIDCFNQNSLYCHQVGIGSNRVFPKNDLHYQWSPNKHYWLKPRSSKSELFFVFLITVIFMMLAWFCLKFLCWKGLEGKILKWCNVDFHLFSCFKTEGMIA